jgi:hypothetical protein
MNMIKPRIIATGATGKTGSVVVQFATDSKVWRREHAIADNFSPAALGHGKAPVAATSRG